MITQEDIDAFMMPEWAERRADGAYKAIRCALWTRDGRRSGNAVNAGTYRNPDAAFPGGVYLVITDAGSVLKLTPGEMKDLFYPPEWIMAEFLPAQAKALEEYNYE